MWISCYLTGKQSPILCKPQADDFKKPQSKNIRITEIEEGLAPKKLNITWLQQLIKYIINQNSKLEC
jgi:hypothetical protein